MSSVRSIANSFVEVKEAGGVRSKEEGVRGEGGSLFPLQVVPPREEVVAAEHPGTGVGHDCRDQAAISTCFIAYIGPYIDHSRSQNKESLHEAYFGHHWYRPDC